MKFLAGFLATFYFDYVTLNTRKGNRGIRTTLQVPGQSPPQRCCGAGTYFQTFFVISFLVQWTWIIHGKSALFIMATFLGALLC